MKKLAIASGTIYVLAWTVGLAVASGGTKPDDPAAKVASYFARHEHTAMLGHLLVDGIAGVALIGIALVLRRALRSELPFWAALAAAVTSLFQFVVGITFTYDAAHGGKPSPVRDLFVTPNDADTVKIVFLAVMIGGAGLAARESGLLPRWFANASLVIAPILALSGFAFPLDSGVLLALLELTLLLLLAWVVTLVTLVVRRPDAEEVTAPAAAAVYALCTPSHRASSSRASSSGEVSPHAPSTVRVPARRSTRGSARPTMRSPTRSGST
jgi:hypothetical protein